MAEVTRERRDLIREAIEGRHDARLQVCTVGDLRALLDAADERDRLREAAKTFCDKLYQESGATYELNPEALERLEALL